MKDADRPWILGIGSSHNGAACLLRGDDIFVAVQEERLLRLKRAAHPAGRASLAIQYCLDCAGIRPSDLSMVGVCCMDRSTLLDDVHLNPLLRTVTNGVPTVAMSHHYGHAVAAFATSGFDEAALLVVDGSGSPWTCLTDAERNVVPAPQRSRYSATDASVCEVVSMYTARGRLLTAIEKHVARADPRRHASKGMPYFFSLGRVFQSLGFQIFGHGLDGAGKVMGLAPFGRPLIPIQDFFNIVDGEFVFGDDVPNRFNHAARWPEHRAEYEDLAASAQQALEHGLLWLVHHLRAQRVPARLCYTGGVALNSVANERIVREGGFDDVFITPAAEDSGTAVGAAYHALWQLQSHGRRRRLVCDAPGRVYSADEIEDAISRQPMLRVAHRSNVIEHAVERLAMGQTLGWFQDGSELGPRALGQRSILADPRRAEMKDVLNSAVKFREGFRPYAPVIPLENVAEWFDVPFGLADSPFMLRVMRFRPEKQSLVPAVVHVDGTGRVQTVASGRLYDLVSHFGAVTGVPMLLNTSFNTAGEPIVETPDDALRCLLLTGLDACVLGDCIVIKAPEYRSIMDLYPALTARWILERRSIGNGHLHYDHAAEEPWPGFLVSASAAHLPDLAVTCGTGAGHHVCLIADGRWGAVMHVMDARAADVLRLMDGARRGWEVLQAAGGCGGADALASFERLLARLIRAGLVRLRAEPSAQRCA